MNYIEEGKKPPKCKGVISTPEELVEALKPLIGQTISMTGKSRTDGSNFRKIVTNHLLSKYMPEAADEMGNRSLESFRAGYAQQGYEADVRQESFDCSLLEWGDGQPALVMDSSYLVCDPQDAEPFTVYIYACILVGREHSFSVWYQTQDPDAMEGAKESGVMETFRITEETYSGPTSVWANWGDVIYYAGLTCLSAAVAVSGLRELLGRGKKKADGQEKGPGGRLPPRE